MMLTAESERLEAELSGAPYGAGPGDGPERITQAEIYDQEITNYQAETVALDSKLGQTLAQLQMDEASLPGLKDQFKMAQALVDIQQQLQDKKAAAPLDVMRAKNAAIDAELRVTNTLGDRNKLTSQRAELEQDRRAYVEKWRSDHNQQLVDARQQLSEATETLNKARRLNDFTALTAPADGTVQEVADRSVGSVVREAETLVTLVPDGSALYVEANVSSRDVGYLQTGQAVRVKLESYPFQRFGTVTGVLEMMSPDSAPLEADNDKSTLVYHARVRLNESAASLAARRIYLRPGLVASAEIKTGKRSIASYILNPVLRLSDESMREP
jgi:HlyD family secretion protein